MDAKTIQSLLHDNPNLKAVRCKVASTGRFSYGQQYQVKDAKVLDNMGLWQESTSSLFVPVETDGPMQIGELLAAHPYTKTVRCVRADSSFFIEGRHYPIEDGSVVYGIDPGDHLSDTSSLFVPDTSVPFAPTPNNDIVNKPDHYTKWPVEPITLIMRNGMEFWRGNIIKYASRAGHKLYDGKDQVESEITDLEKVRRYAEMRINQLKGDTVL